MESRPQKWPSSFTMGVKVSLRRACSGGGLLLEEGVPVVLLLAPVLPAPGQPPTSTGAANLGVNVDVTCTYSYQIVIAQDGVAQIDVDGYDRARNLGHADGSFVVDTQPPIIWPYARTADGVAYTANTWTNQNVTVYFE